MAKVNINTATREELVDVVGLRPEVADEILKFRRKGRIASVEALGELPGIGPATLDQLRKSLDFSDRAGAEGEDAVRGAAEATDNVTELGKQASDAGRRVVERVDEMVRGGVKVAQRSAGAASEVSRAAARRSSEGAAELGRMLINAAQEQTQHNVSILRALTEAVDWEKAAQAVDWERVLRIQSEFLRASLDRSAHLTQRYLEITQAVISAAAATSERETRRAA